MGHAGNEASRIPRRNDAMIHYSCDRCKRRIDPAREIRHVVTIELQTILEPTETDELEEDRDYLYEIDDLLESMDLDSEECSIDDVRRRRYDLCTECYRKYLSDPLGTELPMQVGFSHN
jgi:hypothetical protein